MKYEDVNFKVANRCGRCKLQTFTINLMFLLVFFIRHNETLNSLGGHNYNENI